ncbi:MAG: hypothetical protein IJ740_08450 [Ruminococcus sp.]|nr:hypothetical protein [Ruminococcus sp.]
MQHSFDIDIATEYGVNAAIILNHILFWVEKNEANNQHYHDGRYWTYNSIKAFTVLFPYLTDKQVRVALDKLINGGLVMTGNYNEMRYDRTMWYALTDKGKSICRKGKIHLPLLANGFALEGEPIPDIKPDIKPDINTDKKSLQTSVSTNVDLPSPAAIVEMYHEICKSYPKVRSISAAREKAIRARLRTYGAEDMKEVFEKAEKSDFLRGRNNRNWSANFDWLMKDTNFAKILDGNYDNKDQKASEEEHREIDWDNLPF